MNDVRCPSLEGLRGQELIEAMRIDGSFPMITDNVRRIRRDFFLALLDNYDEWLKPNVFRFFSPALVRQWTFGKVRCRASPFVRRAAVLISAGEHDLLAVFTAQHTSRYYGNLGLLAYREYLEAFTVDDPEQFIVASASNAREYNLCSMPIYIRIALKCNAGRELLIECARDKERVAIEIVRTMIAVCHADTSLLDEMFACIDTVHASHTWWAHFVRRDVRALKVITDHISSHVNATVEWADIEHSIQLRLLRITFDE